MDELVTRILLNVSHEHVLDICNVILLVLILLVADAFLRIIAEVFQYNKDHNRKNTTKTFITTLIWYGWGQGDYIDANTGKIKRYLMSEKLRSSMLKKICIFYPAWFFFRSHVFPSRIPYSSAFVVMSYWPTSSCGGR